MSGWACDRNGRLHFYYFIAFYNLTDLYRARHYGFVPSIREARRGTAGRKFSGDLLSKSGEENLSLEDRGNKDDES